MGLQFERYVLVINGVVLAMLVQNATQAGSEEEITTIRLVPVIPQPYRQPYRGEAD